MGLLEEYRVAVASAIGGWTPTILTHFYKIVVSPTPCTPEREKHYNQFNIKILPSLTSLKRPQRSKYGLVVETLTSRPPTHLNRIKQKFR